MEDFMVGDGNAIKMKPWMKTKKFVLGTVDNINDIMDHCIQSERYALDVETTGLDNRVLDHGGVMKTVDQLVGVCLSPDGVTGYYIPLNHVEVRYVDNSRIPYSSNVPWDVFEKAFRRLITATEEKKTIAIFHSGKFDHEFLNYWGGEPFGTWDKTYMWDDTLILAHLGDSRRRKKGLKALSKELLDIEMIELKELIPDEKDGKGRVIPVKKDFSILDPEEPSTLWYGGGDGICTRLLYDILAPDILDPTHGFNQKLVYKIEKQTVAATRWMERNRIHLDKEKLEELIKIGHKEWYTSIMEVYAAAEVILNRDVMPGSYKILKEDFVIDNPALSIKEQLKKAAGDAKLKYPDPVKKVMGATGDERPPIYDVNSPQQLGTMFDDMGVEGLKRTPKSGQIQTTKDEIDRIVDTAGKQFPFMGKIKRFREISHTLSSYLYPMYTHLDPLDDTIRINFQVHKVDTGRFCTPVPKEPMVGWPKLNLQALPRAGGSKRPECMRRIRECVNVRRPDRVIAACDYSGVELRIVTNLSREPLWLSEFFHCSDCDRTFDRGDGTSTPEPPPARCPNCGSDKIGDLHTLTGISVYGKEAQADPDWKEIRGRAKSLNFALCYGGGGSAAQRATGVDRNEGNRMKRQFEGTYRTLKNWWGAQHDFARQHGFVVTAFKRRYPLPDINHADGFFRSKAERNAINGPIQGCLHPDCRVPTKQGLQRVEDLWNIGKPFVVWTGQKWEQARPLFSGEKDVRETDFNNGNFILTSPEHLFYVWKDSSFQWVKQDDLVHGEWIATDPSAVGFDGDPQTDRNTILPSDIVISIGKTIKKCSAYLGSSKQAAVLRLVDGSGSKSQCLRLLDFYDNPTLPLPIQEALSYDWSRVTNKKDPGYTINMYDVEVLDDLHAFSCNGLIVHNTSADITKIAMGMVYNEMKKRGWLDKVQMIITMHDELVFEMDLDILEEALAVIDPIMCRNVMVLSQKWPVPLTTDVEMGVDWTVPWDLNVIKYKEARFIGDKKYYPPKPGDPDPWPEGYTWDTMETWPDTLRPHFDTEADPSVVIVPQVVPDSSTQQKAVVVPDDKPATENVEATSVEIPVQESVIKIAPEDIKPPKTSIPSGSIFEYQLHIPLSLGSLYQLAHVINLCKNKGTRILRVLTMDGEVLDTEKEYGEILINPSTFQTLANEHIV